MACGVDAENNTGDYSGDDAIILCVRCVPVSSPVRCLIQHTLLLVRSGGYVRCVLVAPCSIQRTLLPGTVYYGCTTTAVVVVICNTSIFPRLIQAVSTYQASTRICQGVYVLQVDANLVRTWY